MHRFFTPRSLSAASLGVALVTVWWVPPCPAPQRDKPEKISIDNVTWSFGEGVSGFHVEHSARFGIANAGDNAEFSIHTLLWITDLAGNPLDLLEQEDLLVSGKGVLPDRDAFTPLAPQLIPWNAIFVGPVVVIAITEVLTPSGQSIATASTEVTALVVREPE